MNLSQMNLKVKLLCSSIIINLLFPIIGVNAQDTNVADFSGLFLIVALFPILFAVLVGFYSYYYWYIPRGIQNRQKTRMSTAIMLKYSTESKKRAKAKQYFESIKDEKFDSDLRVIGHLFHLDYLVKDFKENSTEQNFSNLKSSLDELLILVNKSRKISITPEIYVLQAKLALINKDLETAQKLFNKAEILIDERGLRSLKEVLLSSDEHLFSSKIFEEIKDQSNLAILTRVNFENHLQRVTAEALQPVHGLPKEIPVWLIAMMDSGLSLFSLNFLAEAGLDDQMVGGFLSAINSFIKEALSEKASMDQMRYGEYYLLIQKLNNLNFCYVIRGSPELALKDLKKFSENFKNHTQFSNRYASDDMPSITPEDEKVFTQIAEETFFCDDDL